MSFKLFCTIQILFTSINAQIILQQTTLSSFKTRDLGATILTNIVEVSSQQQGTWKVNPQAETSWQFIISADTSWGFNDAYPSTISLTINSPLITTSDLLFGFTTNNQQYISMSLPMDNTGRQTSIYPGCSTHTIGVGDIAAILETDRSCDIAGGSCNNWRLAPFNTMNQIIHPPITITLENNPLQGTLFIYLSNANYVLPSQFKCQFADFPANEGLKFYIGGNNPFEAFSINSFQLTATVQTTPIIPYNSPPAQPQPQPVPIPVQTTTTLPPVPAAPVTPVAPVVPVLPIYPTLPTLPNIPGPPGQNGIQTPPNYMTTTTTVAPIVTPGANEQYGAFGQICHIATGAEKCGDPSQDIAQDPQFLKCELESDCCLCQTIECGTSENGCYRFSAGEYSAFGVGDVRIHGNTVSGALIDCLGFEGCSHSVITAENIVSVRAGSDMALANAKITIENPMEGFKLDCSGGIGACADLVIELVITGPPPGYQCNPNIDVRWIGFEEIKCTGAESCKNMQFTFKNEGCNPVSIAGLNCGQANSCSGANFNFVGDISVANCGFKGAAHGITGIDKCFENLERFLCPDAASCSNAVRTLTNPVNGFLLSCGNQGSCENSQFTIKVDDSSLVPIHYFDLFKFSGKSSAANAIITVTNSQIDAELNINFIECPASKSCENTTFFIGENVSIGQIKCAPGACNGCTVRRTFNNQILPCDYSV